MKNIKLSQSLERPSWTQRDLYAYRHRITFRNGRTVILKDYYIKSRGLQ